MSLLYANIRFIGKLKLYADLSSHF